ncbi:MAG: GNAT family N-acetyltransferase [Sphingobium sp.]|nr:GNAT family N-acetyltransferase [Sphingobium sp.]
MEIDSPARTDIITALGHLCLGSRLKRLGERLQAGVSTVLGERGYDVQPAQLPLLWALREGGPMTIGQIGERVGVSQPGVSRAIAALEAQGLVCFALERRDKRQRHIAMADKGNALMDELDRTLFPAVEAAVERLCTAAGGDMLGQIGRIEQGLEQDPLDRRIARATPQPGPAITEHVLDRGAWHALTGPQAGYAIGTSLAKRFHPDVGPLAAARDHSPEAIAALAALAPEEGVLATILARPMDLPQTVEIMRCSPALQMIMDDPPAPFDHPDIEMLRPDDALEMRALADLTEPGPFSSRTHELGTFWGVRERGRIIAMAGERMRLAGYGEVSAVCVHPDARGRGLGELLTRKAAATVGARGLKPFLHVYADNAPAIAVYRRVGFRVRSDVIITMFRRKAG